MNTARTPTRVDAEGNLLRLHEQDRTRWRRPMIARGMFHFARSAAGAEVSEYHLQAAIAACHCAAANYAATDWARILDLYDRLVQLDDSPVIALNRAVALAKVKGPRSGIDAVSTIANLESLESYYLLYAVLAEFEFELHNFRAASSHLRKAMQLTEIRSEQLLLSRRLQDCESREG
jgi:RNA polymerase sigma-70 factor (ECF subfamily)